MFTFQQRQLAWVFLKIFLRDKQSIFFSLFFPMIFIFVLGVINDSDPDPFDLGIVNNANSELAVEFIETLSASAIFDVSVGEKDSLRAQLIAGDIGLILVLPEDFREASEGTELEVLVDASRVRQQGIIMPILKTVLVDIERKLRHTNAMFSIVVKDVQARSQRYMDFLLPGILAFTIMQICIAGSGFNVVEYRRKGILKRLFVTPIQPKDFISAIVVARLVMCLTQLTVLLAVAVYFMGAVVVGDLLSLYIVIVLGAVIFLCLGFSLGSIAKTQQSVQAIGNIVIFPQMFLSGIFYPIELLPEVIQPVASVLPLSFVANALREISINGLGLTEIIPDLIGIGVWMVLGFFIATRYFVWREVAS